MQTLVSTTKEPLLLKRWLTKQELQVEALNAYQTLFLLSILLKTLLVKVTLSRRQNVTILLILILSLDCSGGYYSALPRFMSILCWNYHGLGNPRAIRALHSLIQTKKPFVVFLSGTKCLKNKIDSNRRYLCFDYSFYVDRIIFLEVLAFFGIKILQLVCQAIFLVILMFLFCCKIFFFSVLLIFMGIQKQISGMFLGISCDVFTLPLIVLGLLQVILKKFDLQVKKQGECNNWQIEISEMRFMMQACSTLDSWGQNSHRKAHKMERTSSEPV